MTKQWKHPFEADPFDEYWDEYIGDWGPDPEKEIGTGAEWTHRELKDMMREAFNAGSHYGRVWGPYQEFNPFD